MTLTRRPIAWEGGLTPQMDIMSTTTTTSIATILTPIIVTTMTIGQGFTYRPLGRTWTWSLNPTLTRALVQAAPQTYTKILFLVPIGIRALPPRTPPPSR